MQQMLHSKDEMMKSKEQSVATMLQSKDEVARQLTLRMLDVTNQLEATRRELERLRGGDK
jgi:hypothetical protein